MGVEAIPAAKEGASLVVDITGAGRRTVPGTILMDDVEMQER